MASDNGRIVKILSITGGLADLDTDGDGVADDSATLAALGVTDAERQRLASLYVPGQSLWRVPIPHFTPWDCNWGFWPPADAQAPDANSATSSDGPGPGSSTSCGPGPGPGPGASDTQSGSIISCQDQGLGEEVPVAGTPFRLHYQSERTRGYLAETTLRIALRGAQVPVSLKRIDVAIDIAGQHHTASFPPTQLWAEFTWDGHDVYGRGLQGTQVASVRIAYVYDGVYARVARFGYWGNGLPITGSITRREVEMFQVQRVPLTAWESVGGGLGAWGLDVHHTYDPMGLVLHLGTGRRRATRAFNHVITRRNTLSGT